MLTRELGLIERAAFQGGALDTSRIQRGPKSPDTLQELVRVGRIAWIAGAFRLTEQGRAALRVDRNAARASDVTPGRCPVAADHDDSYCPACW